MYRYIPRYARLLEKWNAFSAAILREEFWNCKRDRWTFVTCERVNELDPSSGSNGVISISISTSNLTAEKRENWYVVGGSESGPKCRYDAVRKWAARCISCLLGRSLYARRFHHSQFNFIPMVDRASIHRAENQFNIILLDKFREK